MSEKGIENVRGGSYCQINLSEDIIQLIQKQINNALNLCQECGSNTHFINDCPFKKYECNTHFNNNKLDKIICYRCGREGHIKDDCYASNHINGVILNKQIICYRCGREGHIKDDCYASNHINGIILNKVKITHGYIKPIECVSKINKNEILDYNCKYCNKKFDTLKGVTCHQNLYCKNKK